MLTLLTALACTGPSTTDDSGGDTGADTAAGCVPAELRTYDTSADPGLHTTPDTVMGFSAADVEAAMLGNYTGTYTTAASAVYAVDVVLGVDGVVAVQDYDNCPSEWSAPLVLAISTEQVDSAYLIDDLWSPTLTLTSLDAGAFEGSKPLADFDGTAAEGATGAQAIVRGEKGQGFSWTGELLFDDVQHGTFDVAPAP